MGDLTYYTASPDNKLVKTRCPHFDQPRSWHWLDYKKAVKENFTSDPSGSAMRNVKLTAVTAELIAMKNYLNDQTEYTPHLNTGRLLLSLWAALL